MGTSHLEHFKDMYNAFYKQNFNLKRYLYVTQGLSELLSLCVGNSEISQIFRFSIITPHKVFILSSNFASILLMLSSLSHMTKISKQCILGSYIEPSIPVVESSTYVY